jgi:hypothetical protein
VPNIQDIIDRLDHLNGHMAGLPGVLEKSQAGANERAKLAGIFPVRLPLVTGKASGGVLALGGDANTASGQPPVAPDLGYVWSLRHLVIEGLTAGATPDAVNILRGPRIVWQLNGNIFAQTWGRGEIILNSGETLNYASSGTFAATGNIIVHGMAEQVPAEMIGKFY